MKPYLQQIRAIVAGHDLTQAPPAPLLEANGAGGISTSSRAPAAMKVQSLSNGPDHIRSCALRPSRRTVAGWLVAAPLVLPPRKSRAQSSSAVIRLGLDWRYEGQAALLLHGIDKGFYRDEGLEISVEAGTGSRETIGKIATGQIDIGIGDPSTLVRWRDENTNADQRAVMVLYDRSPAAIIGRRSRGISADLATLAGKKLGAPSGDGAFAQWPVFRAVNKIPDTAVKIETVGFPVREPMLATGEVDAVFGFAHTTPINLRARNVPADDIIVLMMADYGLETYGNVLIASGAMQKEQGDAVRAFVRATLRSVRAVIANPDEAIASVMLRNDAAQRPVELDRLRQVIAQSVLTPWVRDRGFGGFDRDRWNRFLDQLELATKLRDRTRAQEAFTGDFLPEPDARRVIGAG